MKKNDKFPLWIEDIGVGGEGIGHYEGMTFFVKGAVLGDQIQAQAMKLKKNMGYARIDQILKPSKDRVTEPCSIAKQCGGCQLQALSYEKQLEWKARRVCSDLMRIGGMDAKWLDSRMESILGMEDPLRYRNKTQFPIGRDRGGDLISGFYAARSHRIIPVEDCILGGRENAQILRTIKDCMRQNGVEAYDEERGRGLIRHVLIRKGFGSGQIMVCLVINGNKLPKQERFIEALTQIEGMHSISINCNTKRTNVILGEKTIHLWGEERILDDIGDVRFAISPRSFFQVNPKQTKRLYEKALEYANLHGNEVVWDLYCGIGSISLFLAQKAKEVYGIEVIPEAIADAKSNAKLNGISNVQFLLGKAEEILPAFYASEEGDERAQHPDVIVVDPPRKGCDARCLDTMLAMAPERIVYVSCDPATLARDVSYLREGGYELVKFCPVDQFPMSVHVETVALMGRSRIKVKEEDKNGGAKV